MANDGKDPRGYISNQKKQDNPHDNGGKCPHCGGTGKMSSKNTKPASKGRHSGPGKNAEEDLKGVLKDHIDRKRKVMAADNSRKLQEMKDKNKKAH